MDKQQSDHIENRIRQAAEGVTPPFREEAWEKMEELLDKEFSKRRRKGLLWWWLLPGLLLGGIAIFYYTYEPGDSSGKDKVLAGKADAPAPVTSQRTPTDKLPNMEEGTGELLEKAPSDPGTGLSRGSVPEKQPSVVKQPGHGKEVPLSSTPQENRSASGKARLKGGGPPNQGKAKQGAPDGEEFSGNNIPVNKGAKPNGLSGKSTPLETGAETDLRQPGSAADANSGKATLTNSQQSTSGAVNDTVTAVQEKSNPPDSSLTKNVPSPDSSAATQAPRAPIKLQKQSFRRLYFTASLAPDASALKGAPLDNIGTVYGLGIGYRLTKRWSVQTGLYAGRKLYVAGPSDYVVKPGSYWSMVDILKIDADCFILDIPIAVRYDVIQRPKYNLYGTAGLSSILMKTEDYNYHYRRNGDYHQSAYTYKGNKHLFSVVNISAGFERKIFPAFYLQAEPYMKIPLSGVGEGKVKIHSAGLQIGLKYQPLRHKKVKRS